MAIIWIVHFYQRFHFDWLAIEWLKIARTLTSKYSAEWNSEFYSNKWDMSNDFLTDKKKGFCKSK